MSIDLIRNDQTQNDALISQVTAEAIIGSGKDGSTRGASSMPAADGKFDVSDLPTLSAPAGPLSLDTLISAIGGVAMQLALSLVVFDQTESSWLSGLFTAASLVPGMTLPVLLAPMVDRCNRKKIIVTLDYTSAALYLLFFLNHEH